jgi:hypothetical protein
MTNTPRKCSIAASPTKRLEESKKIAYSLIMDYMDKNDTLMDCTVVAIYNALIAAGKPREFRSVKSICIKKKWYSEEHGFWTNKVIDALTYFGVKVKSVTEKVKTKKVFNRVVNKGRTYIFMCNTLTGDTYWDSLPGHAMVIVKGDAGAKILNSWSLDAGWKTLSRRIKAGELSALAIEIKRAA